MSKEITDWIKYELYPSIYKSIDTIFAEHEFKEYAGGWRSKTYLNGSDHKSRADKTVISKKAPGWIIENGGETLSLVDYVMRRDNLSFIDAVKWIADKGGLQVPTGDFTQEDYQKYRDQATILEDCNSYFIFCLENAKGAEEVKAYLSSRGYSDADIKAMELGYIPDQAKLNTYLLGKGYSQEIINEAVKLNKGIGDTHKLSIPYRSGGSVKGFKFRTIGEATPKYLNSTGLDRLGGFFNLSGIKGDKDIVIVEGELDSLSATARGLDNVVSTGGNNISPDQVKDAVKRGAKSFTLCLDNEPGKEEDTIKKVYSAIKIILAEGVNRVYIVTLPDLGGGKTDPDRLIKESGLDAFKDALRGAVYYYHYYLQNSLDKYGKIQTERGLEHRDIDNLLNEIVETAYQIPDAIDRDRYKKLFTDLEPIKDLGITEESLSITIDRLTSSRDKEAQSKELKKVLSEANDLHTKGEIEKALQLLDNKVKEVKLKDKSTEFSQLLIPTSEAQIREEEKHLPDSLNTGFKIHEEDLLLPGGAITVYAAPTNHGKTIFLINTVLNVAERYPDKKFIFFTYEEKATSIIQYFLNAYVDLDLNSSSKTNRRVLKDYFKTGSTQFISSENMAYFFEKKEEFFKTYIETGRIIVKYINYNSQELTLATRYLHKQEPNLGGVFIDYFQLINLPGEIKRAERIGSRQEELKQICIGLKDTAVDTGLPITLAAQFNREVTNLQRLHPTNIGEAGDIERIVNTLIGLWSMNKKSVLKGINEAEMEEINTKIHKRNLMGEVEKNMYLEILKSRDLPTGSYDFLSFNGNTGKMKNRVEEDIKF
jgi:DNA primase catalytic core